MTATEQAREKLLKAVIDPVVRLLETAAGLPVDAPDGLLQGLQGAGDVSVLVVQVRLALRLLLELVDGRQVDVAQAADPRRYLLEPLLPGPSSAPASSSEIRLARLSPSSPSCSSRVRRRTRRS